MFTFWYVFFFLLNINCYFRYINSAFYKACESGDLEIIQLLHSNNADLNLQDGNGNTALHNGLIF